MTALKRIFNLTVSTVGLGDLVYNPCAYLEN